MKWLNILLLSLLAAGTLAGCKTVPGEDGRYAHSFRRDYP